MAYLHSDLSLMPHWPLAKSARNYLALSSLSSSKPLQMVSLAYNMSTLQNLSRSTFGLIPVTLDPPHASP